MFCPRCSANLPENSSFCRACGTPVNQQPGVPVMQTVKVKTYLVESILATLFCCLPFGVVAIIYASKANSCVGNNDIIGAQTAANSAKIWTIVSVSVGLVFSILWFGLSVLAAIAEEL